LSLNNKSEEKQRLRDRLLLLREGLSPEVVRQAGRHVARKVLATPVATNSLTICTYASTGKEIPTLELIWHLLMDGKMVAVPDWEGWKQGSGMRLAAIWGQQDLVTEGRVVPQPLVTPENTVSARDIDLFIGPGLAYGFQVLNRLPLESHDIPVHHVVTPGSGQSDGVDQ